MKHISKTLIVFVLVFVVLTFLAVGQNTVCENTDYQCKVRSYTTQIRDRPTANELYYNRALAYHALGKDIEAVADYTVYINSKPTNVEYFADGYSGRGDANKALGKHTDAIADYTASLNLFTSTITLNNRGNTYFSMSQYANALADYDRAIRLDPKDAEPYYNRAKVYSAQKLYLKAIADLNIYVDLNKTHIPFLSDGYQNRSIAYMNLGNSAAALKDISSAIDLDPKSSRYKTRAIFYRKLGKVALAAADDKTAADLEN